MITSSEDRTGAVCLMKLQLNTPRAKIAVASSFILFGSVISAVLHLSSNDSNQPVSVQAEEVSYERKPPTAQELDDMHSSWLFSSSESAALVDNDNGFEMATIGR